MIKEYIEDAEEVVIITRPRRFGKSLNMSMLQCFLEKPQKDNAQCENVFESTLISEEKEIMKNHYQKYPVIHLTFKEIREADWEKTYYVICDLIRKEINRHSKVIEYENLSFHQFDTKHIWDKIIKGTANELDWKKSLNILSQLLYIIHGKKPIIAIDEYDTPVNNAYLKTAKKDIEKDDSFFQKTLDFMRSLLSKCIKR